MNSKIRVQIDFDTKQPYIQIYHEFGPNYDLADETLKHFIERANQQGIEIIYPDFNQGNECPQIRLRPEGVKLWNNSPEFREWLISKGYEFEYIGQEVIVSRDTDTFLLGCEYGRHQQSIIGIPVTDS